MSRKTKIYVSIIICLVVLVVILGFVLPAIPLNEYTQTTFYYCRNCGAILYHQESGSIRSPNSAKQKRTIEETALSEWYAKHIDENCEHDWERFHFHRWDYVSIWGIMRWRTYGEAGTLSITPRLVYLNEEDRKKLEILLQENPDLCKEFIRKQLDKSDRDN